MLLVFLSPSYIEQLEIYRNKRRIKMINWITQNLATIIVALIILATLCTAIIYMIKNKKTGKSSCGGNCTGCPMGDKCRDNKQL